MALHLPIEPPIEPMLAKATDSLPDGDGWLFEPKWDGFRALVFRDGDEVYTQSRDLKPLDRYFPELADPLRAALPERCVLDGEVVIATDGGLDFEALLLRIHPAASRVKMLAAESPASFVAWDLLALGDEDLRETPQGERRARLEAVLGDVEPPVHLTPATQDRATGRRLVRPVRGGGAGRRGREAARCARTSRASGRCSRSSTSARPTASSRGSAGTRTVRARTSGRCCSGLFDDEGVLHHVGVTSSFTWDKPRGARRGAGAVARASPRRPPVARVGRVGDDRRHRCLRPAPARGHLTLEPRQGPVVGAAPGRAGRRGRLRPPPGRPASATGRRSSAGARTSRRRPAATTSSRRRRRTCSRRSSAIAERRVVRGRTPIRPGVGPHRPDFRLIGAPAMVPYSRSSGTSRRSIGGQRVRHASQAVATDAAHPRLRRVHRARRDHGRGAGRAWSGRTSRRRRSTTSSAAMRRRRGPSSTPTSDRPTSRPPPPSRIRPRPGHPTKLEGQLATLIRPREILRVELRRPDGTIVAANDPAIRGTSDAGRWRLRAGRRRRAQGGDPPGRDGRGRSRRPRLADAPARVPADLRSTARSSASSAIWRDAVPILDRLGARPSRRRARHAVRGADRGRAAVPDLPGGPASPDPPDRRADRVDPARPADRHAQPRRGRRPPRARDRGRPRGGHVR